MGDNINVKRPAAAVSSLAAAAARMTLTSAPKKTSNVTSDSATKDTCKITRNHSHPRKQQQQQQQVDEKCSLAQYASTSKPKEQSGGKGGRGQHSSLQNYKSNPTKPKDERHGGTAPKVKKPHKPHQSAKKKDSLPPIAQFEMSLDDDGDTGAANDNIPGSRSRRNGRRSKNVTSHQEDRQHQNSSKNGKVINVNVSKRLIGSALGRRIPSNNNGITQSQKSVGGHHEQKKNGRNDNRCTQHQHGIVTGNRAHNSIARSSGREKRDESRSWGGGGGEHGKHHGYSSRRTWNNGENTNNASVALRKNPQGRHDTHEFDSNDTARLNDDVLNPKLVDKEFHRKPRLVSKSEVKGPIERTQMSNWADDSDSDSD